MSLKEIKAFLEQRSTESFLKICESRESELEQEILRLKRMKQWITQRKQRIKSLQKCDFSSIKRVCLPRRYYFYEDVYDPTPETYFMKINELITELKKYHVEADYDIVYTQWYDKLKQGIYDSYDNVMITTTQTINDENVHSLPSGEYLVAYHIGD